MNSKEVKLLMDILTTLTNEISITTKTIVKQTVLISILYVIVFVTIILGHVF
jgi:hypothetical protein